MAGNDTLFDLRDGTGQNQRYLAALDPSYFLVDERDTAELLRYARLLAQRIRYFGSDGTPGGSWSAFLDDAEGRIDLATIAAYLDDPGGFTDDVYRRDWLSRPHFVLWLTFLELSKYIREDINQLTKRHLDFYYREVLGIAARPALSDEIHLLLQLTKGVQEYRLPAGTLLQAGKDAKGRPRTYRTNQEIVVNNAQIGELRNVFLERRFSTVPEYFREDSVEPNPFAKVLRLVYSATPDASLPVFNGQNINTDATLVSVLRPLLDFSYNKLFLALSEFRRLMRMNDRRRNDAATWKIINDILRAAGQKKRKDTAWTFATVEEKNFSARFNEALGFDPLPTNPAPPPPFSGMQGVNDLFDLFEQLEEMLAKRRDNDPTFDNGKLNEFKDFLDKQLFMVKDTEDISKSDFLTMMDALDDIRRDWAGINRWLTKAGALKRKNPSFNPRWPELPTFPNFPDLNSRLIAALETSPFGVTVAGWNLSSSEVYWEGLKAIEQYFFLPFEDVKLIIETIANTRSSSSALNVSARQSLPTVFELLSKAYKEKNWSAGIKTIENERKTSFIGMLNYALGEPEKSDWPSLNNKTQTAQILDELRTKNTITDQYIAEKLFMQRIDFSFLLNLYDHSRDGDVNNDPTEEEWQRLYRLLEATRRIKRKLADPVPGLERFSGIYATSAPEKTNAGTWPPFGETETGDLAEIGLAFCSPLLELAEGERIITLKIATEVFSLASGKLSDYFDFWLSSTEGWLKAADLSPTTPVNSKIENVTVSLLIAADAPAVSQPSPGVVTGDPSFPVLKMVLKQAPIGGANPYRVLKNLVIKKVELGVRVSGISPTQAQNDLGIVDAAKAFEPFGPAPKPGSSLLFAHPELCFKPLSKIGFLFEWKGIITNLDTHYTNYPSKPNELNAAAQLSLLKRGSSVSSQAVGLFQQYNLGGSLNNKGYREYATNNVPEIINGVRGETIPEWSRYWRIDLTTDFLHGDYSKIASEKAMAFAIAMKIKTTEAEFNAAKDAAKLNPPYTPNLKNFKIFYEAGAVVLDVSIEGTEIFSARHSAWQLHPFGHSPLRKENRSTSAKAQCFLLPEYQKEGELYIGLRNSEPLQTISLLFQMAEGSANPDLEKYPVDWSCLTPNGWQTFDKGEILLDETDSFSNSGILKLVLPANLTRDNPLMPIGLHWLRASISTNRASVNDVIGIFTQSVTATRILDPESVDDPGQPLPPNTIKGFYERQAGIKKLEQPFASFGGRSAESAPAFYTRVSERLHHRQRPLTQWDIERLVLQEFPDVYKVKCLTTPDPAGVVKIIVVPDIRGKVLYDAFRPKMPLNRLAEIANYLKEKGSPLAIFSVMNPVYISLEVRAYVRFRAGYDPRYYLGLLDEELQRFLAPWAFDSGADIAINHTIYPSVIVNFIEERPYVDFVTGVRLFQTDPDNNISIVDANSDGIEEPARPDAIWVSARKHFIELAENRPDQVSITYDGIEFMRIEYDFAVA